VFSLLREYADLHYTTVCCITASTSRLRLSGDDVEKILEETLSDSEHSLFDSDNNSSVIEDLLIYEAIVVERSENQDSDSV
jgi:hypothetical protein